jgi:hypothetical protein
MRQLNAEPKLVYKVRFIREKGKATAKVLQRRRKLVAGCSGEGWGFYGRFNSGLGGFFSLARDSRAFSGELVWLAPFLGEGNNLESIFSSALWQICISPLGCRNAGLHLLRMLE